MARIRRPSAAGTFYPGDASTLSTAIQDYVGAAGPPVVPAPKALVVPHAGYVYSGPVAGSAYATLANCAEAVSRVILLGPSHRVSFRGLACTEADCFLTPLGALEVDQEVYDAVLDLPRVERFETPYEGEHCLEVQLPFLQRALTDFRIVPFLVGDASIDELAAILERLWGGAETLIVVSSDLSHYLPYEIARRSDAATARAVEALSPEDIGHDQACGRIPLNGLLRAARRRGLKAVTLDLRNSGDTEGPRDQVVGYGAWAFLEDAAH